MLKHKKIIQIFICISLITIGIVIITSADANTTIKKKKSIEIKTQTKQNIKTAN